MTDDFAFCTRICLHSRHIRFDAMYKSRTFTLTFTKPKVYWPYSRLSHHVGCFPSAVLMQIHLSMSFIIKPEFRRLHRNRLRHYDVKFSLPYTMIALRCLATWCGFFLHCHLMEHGSRRMYRNLASLKILIDFLILHVCTEQIDIRVTLF